MENNTVKIRFPKQNAMQQELQQMSVAGLNYDYVTPRCNRARLDTGPLCNYDCEFCYYRDKLDQKTAWDVVKERIDYLHSYGITEVDLSGGESSMSPDWFKILDYCNERFTSISCLSHGGTFANMNHLKKSKEHGLKEILFSLHGPTKETHETITNRPGSFEKILQGIKNAQELGMIVRINCTVYSRNYHQLETIYADLINGIKPVAVNFITLNYWLEDNETDFSNVNLQALTEGIKRCIDKIDKSIEILVRYTPFCYMKGYEQYQYNIFQHIYDVRDWNREMYNYDIDVDKTYSEEEKVRLAYEAAADHRERFYRKDSSCLKCKYFYVCDGVKKEMNEEFYPEEGDKIKDVNFFINKQK